MKTAIKLTDPVTSEVSEELRHHIDQARRVAVVCHLSPDGDALGSSLAMMHLMRRLGKTCDVITPDTPPQSLDCLPGFDQIVAASMMPERAHVILGTCDLLLCLDFNSPGRVDKLAPLLGQCRAFKVMIDHHENPDLAVDIAISDPHQSSTCVLLYRVLRQIGANDLIDATIAECLMAGLLTDTGGLAYNTHDPELYVVVAELVARGVDKDELYRQLFRTSSLDRLRLHAFAVLERMTIYPSHRAAVITLSADELKSFNYVKGMTEGLVNTPLEMPDIIYSVFLRQSSDKDFVKVSMRSKGHFPVDRFCRECFGGGGHVNAAGGDMHDTLAETLRRVEEAMDSFDQFLPDE